ncbi:hypothetical protein [Salinibacterium sp. PAMC 21357]|uniref:hypothetical protein n=1 Tax=Salinibacterium sp. PAMC 21357 TaxID=1112215 RepID=UPI000288CC8B|nr:hypothetical protein [Salinibacterium sp. PAMC 21357]
MKSQSRKLAAVLLTFVAVPLLTVTLAGCGDAPPADDNSEFSRQPTTDDFWQVGVQYPEGDVGDCGDDGSIADGIMSADAPSSRYVWTLTQESGETDAERIADCLKSGLTGGTITIYEPAE